MPDTMSSNWMSCDSSSPQSSRPPAEVVACFPQDRFVHARPQFVWQPVNVVAGPIPRLRCKPRVTFAFPTTHLFCAIAGDLLSFAATAAVVHRRRHFRLADAGMFASEFGRTAEGCRPRVHGRGAHRARPATTSRSFSSPRRTDKLRAVLLTLRVHRFRSNWPPFWGRIKNRN